MGNLATNKLTKVWETWSNNLRVKDLELSSIDEISDLMAHIFCPGPFYFYLFDFSKFEFQYIHPSIKEVLGTEAHESNFENIAERIHPDDLPLMEQCEKMAAFFLFETIPASEIENYKVSYSYRVRTNHGGYRLILHQALAHTFDETGRLQVVLGVHTDVSHLMNSSNRRISFCHIKGGPSFYGLDPFILDMKQLGPPIPSISPRELEILHYLSEGDTVKQISEKMPIALDTIRTHRNNIRKKLHCKNTTQMVVKVIRMGLL